MSSSNWLLSLASLAALAFAIGCGSEPAPNDAPVSEQEVDAGELAPTSDQVLAILTSRCMPCHGGAEPQEELNMETMEGLMKGGEHGAVVVAGDAANSMIVQALRKTGEVKAMPPATAPQPTEDEIKTIEGWIQAGAKTG